MIRNICNSPTSKLTNTGSKPTHQVGIRLPVPQDSLRKRQDELKIRIVYLKRCPYFLGVVYPRHCSFTSTGEGRAMRKLKGMVLVVLALLAAPGLIHAQGLGTIAGVVRDASGAVLPGVTVEVASPALIEKSRTAITNESGQYTVVSLPPGIYIVTFSLPGFSTTKREGLEMLANFTAQVNAEMKVGGLAETIDV